MSNKDVKKTKKYEKALDFMLEVHNNPSRFWYTYRVMNLIKFEVRKKLLKFFKEEKSLSEEEKLSIINQVRNSLNWGIFYGKGPSSERRCKIEKEELSDDIFKNLSKSLLKNIQEELKISKNTLSREYKNKKAKTKVSKIFKELEDFKEEYIINYCEIEEKIQQIEDKKQELWKEWYRSVPSLHKSKDELWNNKYSREKNEFILIEVNQLKKYLVKVLEQYMKDTFYNKSYDFNIKSDNTLLYVLKADQKLEIYNLKEEEILNLDENKLKELASEQIRSFVKDFFEKYMRHLRNRNKTVKDEVLEEIEQIIKKDLMKLNKITLTPKKETYVRKNKKSIEV